jgi:hypothetical protein
MASYQYVCENGHTAEVHNGAIPLKDFNPPTSLPACSAGCGSEMKRKYSLSIHRPMHDHYNNTTGTMIGSDRQFREELKRQSEAATIKTGIEHNFEPIDRAELKKNVVASDGAGLESTNRERVKNGQRAVDL